MSEPLIIQSEDGSHTLISEQFQVSYHSTHGSLQESNTVFIQAGLEFMYQKGLEELAVFEMGFGSGLNALMAYLWAGSKDIKLTYLGVEAYPITLAVAESLNYPKLLGDNEKTKELFLRMHSENAFEDGIYQFQKYIVLLEDAVIDQAFDVIFYDAFAPSSQEYLWEQSIMEKMFGILKPGGVLVTYCAKGNFKRTLKAAGFVVEALPGPKGKREMTRAIKPEVIPFGQ